MVCLVSVVGNHIPAVAFLEDIGVGFVTAAVQSVISGSAVQNVAAFAAVQLIVAFPAFEDVGTFLTTQGIVARIAFQRIGSFAAVKTVIAFPAFEQVVAVIAVQIVVAFAAVQYICGIPAVEAFVAVGTDAFHLHAGHVFGGDGFIVKGKVVVAVGAAAEITLYGYGIFTTVGFDDQVVVRTGKYGFGKLGTVEAQGIGMVCLVSVVGNHIPAVAFLEDIGVGFVTAAVQSVISGSAVQNVAAFAAVQLIVAFPAFEDVGTFLTTQGIVARIAFQRIGSFAAVKTVIAFPAFEQVVAVIAVQIVVAFAAVQYICGIPAVEAFVAVGTDAFHLHAGHVFGGDGFIVKGKVVVAVGAAAEITLYGYGIFTTVGFDDQVVVRTGKYGFGKLGTVEAQGIGMVCLVSVVGNHIPAVAFLEDVGVGFAATAVKAVVSGSSCQSIFTCTTL